MPSAARHAVATLRAYGWQTGERFGRRKLDHSGSSDGFSTLVDLGYDLIDDQQLAQAAAIFRFNLKQHAGSSYSHDGLADVALAQGDKTLAAKHFEQALVLDSENDYAQAALKRLRKNAKTEPVPE